MFYSKVAPEAPSSPQPFTKVLARSIDFLAEHHDYNTTKFSSGELSWTRQHENLRHHPDGSISLASDEKTAGNDNTTKMEDVYTTTFNEQFSEQLPLPPNEYTLDSIGNWLHGLNDLCQSTLNDLLQQPAMAQMAQGRPDYLKAFIANYTELFFNITSTPYLNSLKELGDNTMLVIIIISSMTNHLVSASKSLPNQHPPEQTITDLHQQTKNHIHQITCPSFALEENDQKQRCFSSYINNWQGKSERYIQESGMESAYNTAKPLFNDIDALFQPNAKQRLVTALEASHNKLWANSPVMKTAIEQLGTRDDNQSLDEKCRTIGALAQKTHDSLHLKGLRNQRETALKALSVLQDADPDNVEYLLAKATHQLTGKPQVLSGQAYTLALGEKLSHCISHDTDINTPTLQTGKLRFGGDNPSFILSEGDAIDRKLLTDHCAMSAFRHSLSGNMAEKIHNLEQQINDTLSLPPPESHEKQLIDAVNDKSNNTSAPEKLLSQLLEHCGHPSDPSKKCPDGVDRIIRILENPVYNEQDKEARIRQIGKEKCCISSKLSHCVTRAPETSAFYYQLTQKNVPLDQAYQPPENTPQAQP